MSPNRNIIAVCLAAAVLTMAAAGAIAAPKAELWARWKQHDPESTARIDHAAWSGLIAKYRRMSPDGIARFAYGAVSAADSAALKAYIGRLANTPVSRFNRREQFAYWVNFYNALTVRTVLDHYPVESIRDIDITPGWFADGPWGAKQVIVIGESLARRYRTPDPAADLGRSADPLRGQLCVARLSRYPCRRDDRRQCRKTAE